MRRFLILSLLWAVPALAQVPDTTRALSHADVPQIHAFATGERIKVDGKLDDESWAKAQPVEIFTQRDPEEGKPGSERTEVRILIGDDALYVGARLHDKEAGKIRRRLVRRDDDLASDYFALLIDSYHDHLTTYRFRVNPAGSYDDSYIDARGNSDFSWDPVWHVHTTMDAEGWTAEMEIPLSQLHYTPGQESVWGIQMRRWIDRKQELQEFSFVPKKEISDASRYGHLVDLGQLPSPKHLEVLPYSLAKAHYHKVASEDPFQNGSDRVGSIGADLKYGLTSSLTLNATVNPDFGQVEVDPAVVNLTAFETFFPERRPFFIEGADLFKFGVTRSFNNFNTTIPFHARRIGREPSLTLEGANYGFVNSPSQTTIDAALKLTGKTRSGWSVGILDALTSEEHARYLDTTGVERKDSVEPLANYTVARLRRDLKGGNTAIGGIATGVVRNLSDPTLESMLRSNAFVGGVDFTQYWKSRAWSLDGFLAMSHIRGTAAAIDRAQRSSARYYQRPDADHLDYDPTRTSLSGGAAQLSLNKIGGEHWEGSLTYQDWSPGFEINDVGFLNAADSRGYSTLVLYKENKPGKILRSWDAFAFTNHSTNHAGDLTYQGYEAQGEWTFSNYWWGNSRISWYPTAFDDRLTRGGPMARIPNGGRWNLTLNSDTRKSTQFNGQANYTWNDAGGRSQTYTPILTVHPVPSALVKLSPTISKTRDMAQYITTVDDPTATGTYGARYVFGTLDQTSVSLDTRVNWTFSPKLSLQLYLQPFVVTGSYKDLKQLREPRTYEFDVYGRQAGTIQRDSTGVYTIDPDGAGPAASFGIGNPDFNFRSLLGNAVLRWEYRPGSAIFLVWQQSRSETQPFGDFDFSRDFRALMDNGPENVVAVKATYWLGI
ncbi:MAG TPA: DUF5916 domain-containing protein [Candidatus Polarisedimenticolia bacterium]|nr:DUF5916 domain-containing protein [Candidatus Polarisedimenticolia bacterium]